MSDEPRPREWPRAVRDRWFYGFLALSAVSVAVVLSVFFTPLLLATVVVVVSWPLNLRARAWLGGRALPAAALSTAILLFVVFGPVGTVISVFLADAVGVVQQGVRFVATGELQQGLRAVRDAALVDDGLVSRWVLPVLPPDFDVVDAVAAPLQQGLLALLNALGGAIPGLLNRTVALSIDAVVFLVAVVSLFADGPRVLVVLQRLSPLDDVYERRLFAVFGEFASNMVVGALATAGIQGLVAGIGYAIAGAERVVFLAILTGLLSFVPLIGTVLVWVPVAVGVGFAHGLGWGLFVAVWSLAFTGTVDNLVRPLFLRGSTNIHPLLIFLAVLGGLQWIGFAGLLLGPVLLAFFLALYQIYCEDFLGLQAPPVPPAPSLAERLRAWTRPRVARASITSPEAAPVREEDQSSSGSPTSSPPSS